MKKSALSVAMSTVVPLDYVSNSTETKAYIGHVISYDVYT